MSIKHMVDAAGNLALAISCTVDPKDWGELVKIRRALLKLLQKRGVIMGQMMAEEPVTVEEAGKE